MFRSLRWSVFLLGALGVIAALGVAIQGAWTQDRMERNAAEVFVSKDIVADILPPPMYLIEVRLVLSQAIEGSLEPVDAQRELQRLAKDYKARVDHWRTYPLHGLEQSLLGAQHVSAERFLVAAQDQVLAPLLTGQRDTARSQLAAVHALYLEHRAGVDKTVQEANAFAASSMDAFDRAHRSSLWIALALTGVAVLAVLGASMPVLRSIDEPLRRCTQLARRIADGDLSTAGATVHPVRRDVIGQLEVALADMRTRLAEVVHGVRASADAVATSSLQIASGNLDLSRRTEQQASALQETAASMEQLGSTVKINEGNAHQASQLAAGASQVAAQGGSVVSQVVSTMQGIQTSARRIADISSMIDSIAFQTNILALNAAVEAARAGEQGRGFAVVAGEVRSLAQRSAEASREIKTLIASSVDAAQQGASLADQAGRTMQDIVASIQRVSVVVGEISNASREQSMGVAQAGAAVVQIDQATQQNAALVEQSAAAAESLKHQAQRMVEAMAVFRLTA